MFDHQVLYIQIHESIKECKLYRAEYLVIEKQKLRKKQKEEFESLYVLHFLGTKKIFDEKKRFIEYFLAKYYSNKDNYLWSFQEKSDIEDDRLIAVIIAIPQKK